MPTVELTRSRAFFSFYLFPFAFASVPHRSRSTICYARLPFNALPFQPQRDETLGNAKHFLNIGECCHWIVVVVH